MDKLISRILDCLWDELRIPEDLLYEFTVKTTKMIQSRCIKTLPTEFWELERFVELYWRAQAFEEKNTVHVYEMGRLLSLTNMLGMIAEQEEKRRSLDEYAIQFREWYPVFKEIHDMPGITHEELKKVIRKSDLYFAKFINKNQREDFCIYHRFGQEKCYYLTTWGEQLYVLMKNSQRHSFEEKYDGILELRNNIEKSIINLKEDSNYKCVSTNEGKFIKNTIYYTDNINTSIRKPELLAEIHMNKMIIKGGEESCQKRQYLQMQNRL